MKTAADILTALHDTSIPMTTGQIKEAWDALKARHSYVQGAAVRQFHVGDLVAFEARGATHQGNVTRINQKTVSVRVMETYGPVKWKVTPSFLTKVN